MNNTYIPKKIYANGLECDPMAIYENHSSEKSEVASQEDTTDKVSDKQVGEWIKLYESNKPTLFK